MNDRHQAGRRTVLKAAAGIPLLGAGALSPGKAATASTAIASVAPRNPLPVDLQGPALLEAFMKMKTRTDGGISVGWMDAVTSAFIEGEAFPLYRLFAATWYRFTRVSPERYEGAAVEVATYHDVESGEELQSLRMPVTDQVVAVPRYRSGPSRLAVELELAEERKFGMAQASGKEGGSFFREGMAKSRMHVARPERDGPLLVVRQTHQTRVIPGDPAMPGFFYSESTIYRGSWDAAVDPKVARVPAEVAYASQASFRPWMKMGATPGHTVQSGLGGTVQEVGELPDRLLALLQKYHPDLVEDPAKVFAQPAH